MAHKRPPSEEPSVPDEERDKAHGKQWTRLKPEPVPYDMSSLLTILKPGTKRQWCPSYKLTMANSRSNK